MTKLLIFLEKIEETIISYLLAGMVVLSFVNVILRRLFNSGLFWSLEAILFLFLVFVLFGMSYITRKSLHIGIDFCVDLLKPRSKKIITLLSVLLSIIYSISMVFASSVIYNKYYDHKYLSKVTLEDIPVPIWMVYLILMICFAYLSLTLIFSAYEIVIGKRQSITVAHEAAEQEAEVIQNMGYNNSGGKS